MSMNTNQMDKIKRDLKDRKKANDIYISMAKIDVEKANGVIVTLEHENREITSQIRQIAQQGGIQ